MSADRALCAPSDRRPLVLARRSCWAVATVVSALLTAACGTPPTGAPPLTEPTTTAEPTTTVATAPVEPTAPAATEPAIPVAPPAAVPSPEPAAPPSSVRGIPLAEARAAGLWGRPPFAGCVSVHGTPSPDWFDAELLAAAGWPSSQWTNVCHVVGCESNFEPGRIGGLGNRMVGLLQLDRRSWGAMVASLGHTMGDLLTPLANLRVGRALFEHLADAHGSGEAWLPSSMGGWSCAWAAR